jgi:hypothetical protein
MFKNSVEAGKILKDFQNGKSKFDKRGTHVFK